jgi:hypothetical protein
MGKFYVPKEEILLPLYLNKKNQDFYLKLANKKNIPLSDLINSLLSKDKEIMTKAASMMSMTETTEASMMMTVTEGGNFWSSTKMRIGYCPRHWLPVASISIISIT